MKIYEKIVMGLNGEVLYEESYDYNGTMALCLGGGSNKKAMAQQKEAADRSYELQLEQMKLQEAQLAEIKRKETEEELQKKLAVEGQLQRRRTGAKATILTEGKDLGQPLLQRKTLYG